MTKPEDKKVVVKGHNKQAPPMRPCLPAFW
jgi:hypothetical protein